MTAPRQEGICKDCDTYREKIFTNIQRTCTWTCTAVDPKEKCPCRPSHFVPARDTTVRVTGSEAVLDELTIMNNLRITLLIEIERCLLRSDYMNVKRIIDYVFAELQSQQTKEREQNG